MKNARWIVSLGITAAVAGCSLGSSNGGTPVRKASVEVSVFVPSPVTAFAADTCGNTITSAQLVFRRLRLDGDLADCSSATPSPAATGTPEPGDDAGECEVESEIGPFLVDLTAGDVNGVFQSAVITASLPVGHYDRARFDWHKIEDGTTVSDPALQEMADLGLSLRITGTTTSGAAFTIESDVNDEQEVAIDLTVGDVTTGVEGITLTVDPGTWFGQPGACLDPLGSVDPIEDAVRASIDLEEDDDHDGSEDEGGSPSP